MRNGGGSSQPGDIERHFEVWEGKVLRTGSVRGDEKVKTFETAFGLNQAASQASQPGPAAAAAGPPTADGGGGIDAAGPPAADGGGGGATDALVIELTRKISAIEAQIEQLEQRNGILCESIKTFNSLFASVVNFLKQCASSLSNKPGPHDSQSKEDTRPPRRCVLSCFEQTLSVRQKERQRRGLLLARYAPAYTPTQSTGFCPMRVGMSSSYVQS